MGVKIVKMTGEYHAFLTSAINNVILSLEKDGINRKGKLVVTRGRKVVHPYKIRKGSLPKMECIISGKFCLRFFLGFFKDAGQERAKMFRMPRTRYQDRVEMFRGEDGKCKLVFTRVILVSSIPKIVRIISIEKEVALK